MPTTSIELPPSSTAIAIGTEVDVRRRFDGAWARGFEVCEQTDTGYRLRRLSDGSVLPVAFPPLDVRAALPRSA